MIINDSNKILVTSLMEAWIKWEVSNTISTLTPRGSVFWMFGSNCLISSMIISGFPVEFQWLWNLTLLYINN